jgi:pimeloyl-ACP methyl ester carboxylesterase
MEMGIQPEAIREMENRFRSYHRASMIAAFRRVPQWLLPLGSMPNIKFPVYILAWENDPVHDIAIARTMMKFLPNARLRIIPGVFTPNIGEIYEKEMSKTY